MQLLPESEWTRFTHRVIYHGRETCIARKPLCEQCVLNDICPSRDLAGIDRVAGARAKGVRAKADPASPRASTGRSARSATPPSPIPRGSRTSKSPRGRKPST